MSRSVSLIPLTAAVLIAAGAAACGDSAPSPDESGGVIAVTTEPARLETMREAVTLNGMLVPAATADFLVTAPEPARIEELALNEGDVVSRGDVLVRFDIPSVSQAVASRELEMSEAQHRLERARSEADRLNRLFEQGLTSRNSWEAARAELAAAQAHLSGVRAQHEAAQGLSERAVVRAPFSGIVQKRWKSQGEVAAGGDRDPVLRLVDPARVQVLAQVAVGESARIAPGQTAQILVVGGSGEAAVVSSKLPPAPNAATVEVRLDFVTPTTLPIDSPVQIDLMISERAGVLVIPSDAIQRVEGVAFVWVPDENSRAARREVGVGSISGRRAQVTSGLSPGDLVIVTGIAQLSDGTPIQISR